MRYLLLVMVLCGTACGERNGREGDVRHLDAANAGKREVILATQRPNGQYCFYGNSVASAAEQGETFSEQMIRLAHGSELLTPYSLHRKDVRDALLMESKNINIATHLQVNPVTTLADWTCFASIAAILFTKNPVFLKVAWVSCGISISAQVGAFIAYGTGMRKNKALSKELVSPHMDSVEMETIARLRKIFTWLESRDAEQCPAEIEIPLPQSELKEA